MNKGDMETMSCLEALTFCVTRNDSPNEKTLTGVICKVQKQLKDGLGYFKPYKLQSEGYLAKKKLNDYVSKFLTKLCSYLNLSEEVVHTLFVQFLSSDGHLVEGQLKALLNSGHATLEVMHRIRNFYYEERLSLLRLYKLVFSGWHDNWEVLSDIVFVATGKKEREELIDLVLNDYKILADMGEPNWTERISICDEDEEMEAFLQQCLLEKLEILETLMLGYFSCSAPTVKQFDSIVALFKSESFGRTVKILRPLMKHSHQRLIEKITLFQTLIITRLCNLESLTEIDKSAHFLSKNQQSLRHLCTAINGLGDRPGHGPLILLGAITQLIFATTNPPATCSSVQHMSDLAIRQLNVFSHLLDRIQQPPLAGGANLVSVAAHSLLYDLLAAVLSEVELQSLGEARVPLLALLSAVLEVVVAHDRRKSVVGLAILMDDLAKDFPRDLSLVRLCTSLMTDDSANSELVASFLSSLSTFADCVDSLPEEALLSTGGRQNRHGHDWQLRQSRYPYGYQRGVCLPSGTEGVSQGNLAMVWSFDYSVWDVILGELALVHDLLTDQSANCVSPSVPVTNTTRLERLSEVISFTAACLKAGLHKDRCAQVTSEAWSLLECGLLQVCLSHSTSPQLASVVQSLCADILRLAGMILSGQVDKVLIGRITQRVGLLPHLTSTQLLGGGCVGGDSSDTSLPEDFTLSISLIHQLLGLEQTQGRYPVTQAYLSLCLGLAQADRLLPLADATSPGTLIGGLVFTVHQVLASFQQWKFASNVELLDIGEKCLLLFNEVLTQHPSTAEWGRRVILVQQVVCRLISGSQAAVRALIALSSISVETLIRENDQANEMLSVSGYSGRLSRVVWLSLTLLNHLTSHSSTRASLLPLMETSVQSGLHYMAALMTYLSFPYHLKMTRMAVNLLKRMVQLSSVPLVSCLGESSATLRDVFLRRLASPSECPILRSALFDLLAECVLCGRPSLLHLLMTSANGEPADTGCLDCALAVVRETKIDDDASTILLWSVCKFFSALWLQDCHSVVREIKKSPDFWGNFTQSLLDIFAVYKETQEPRTVTELELLGHIFSVLSMEVYSCGWENCTPQVQDAVNSIAKTGCHESFCQMLMEGVADETEQRQQLVSALYMCSGRWKSFLVVLIARPNPPDCPAPLSRPPVTTSASVTPSIPNISSALLKEVVTALIKTLHFMDLTGSATDALDLGGQLASTVAIIVRRRLIHDKSLLLILLRNLSALLTKLTLTVCHTASSIHVDLLATCSLLLGQCKLLNQPKDESLWQNLFHSSVFYTQKLTLKVTLAPIEEKVLIHSVTLMSGLIDDKQSITSSTEEDSQEMTEVFTKIAPVITSSLSILESSMVSEKGLSLSMSILSLLAQLSSYRSGALSLSLHPIVDSLCLPAINSLTQWTQMDGVRTTRTKRPTSPTPITCWSDMVTITLELVTSLHRHLGNAFFPVAAGFLSSYWLQLRWLGLQWNMTLSASHLAVGRALVRLIWSLAGDRNLWSLHLADWIVQDLLTLTSETLYSATSLLFNTRHLQQMLDAQGTQPTIIGSSNSSELQPTSEATPVLIRTPSLASEEATDSLRLTPIPNVVEAGLISLVSASLSVLWEITPAFHDIMYQPLEDMSDMTPLLDLNMTSPSPESSDHRPSFGLLLSILTVSGKMITRIDCRSSPSKQFTNSMDTDSLKAMRGSVTRCQDLALSLLTSQAMIVLNNPSMEAWVKHHLTQGLSAEMTHCDRALRRSQSGSRPSPNKILSTPQLNTSVSSGAAGAVSFSSTGEPPFYPSLDRFFKTLLK